MISITEALALVLEKQKNYGTEKVPLLQSIGRILTNDVAADRDYPAFNRVMMDGIAITTNAVAKGLTSFTVQSIQAAGDAPLTLIDDSHCIEIMTGAVLPHNTDAVIPYEDITIVNGTAIVNTTKINSFQNIHKQGSDCRKGAVLLKANTKITAAHIGILASVGCNNVPVKKLPRIAICSTGNELVEIDEQPLPYQIRKSNSYMLAAALQGEGIAATVYHFEDDETVMKNSLQHIINTHDVLILSGAVSKGKFDHLPAVLSFLGMHTIFHRIAQRPGKPMLFGECANGVLIFGLPGNPMSTFVCYQLYFKAWLYQSMGHTPKKCMARLAKQVVFTPNLAYHIPVILQYGDGIVSAIPVPGSNSGDIPSLSNAEGVITLPAGQDVFEEGLLVNVTVC